MEYAKKSNTIIINEQIYNLIYKTQSNCLLLAELSRYVQGCFICLFTSWLRRVWVTGRCRQLSRGICFKFVHQLLKSVLENSCTNLLE